MSKKVFLIIGLIVNTIFAQSGWQSLSCGLNVDFYTLYFTSVNTGFVAGNQFIIKTTDGGSTWMVSLYQNVDRYRHLIFVNQNTGIVIGRDGLIMKTTNQGVNWVSKNSGTINDMLQFCMVNEDTGYLCGGFGTYLKTTNGGDSWSGAVLNNSHMYAVNFTSASTGWIGGDLGLLYKTTNGGNNWVNKTLPQIFNIREIFFLNPSTGWVAGMQGLIYFSSDGGNNWQLQNSGTMGTFHHIMFRNSGKGWAVGDTSIISSNDFGAHWNYQYKENQATLVQSFFLTDSVGYVTGWSGKILKTTNGGSPVGITPESNNVPKQFLLSQNYPNPFNPSTIINYELSREVGTGQITNYVKLAVYDVWGREVAILVNKNQTAGNYKVKWNASNYPSGVYFYKLITGNYSETKKMVLLK